MNRRTTIQGIGAAIAASALPSWPAAAQAKYPDHPIRLVVPYPPGGVVDSTARHWIERMKPFGTMVIENLSGGGGTIGASAVAHAQPDGYTLLFSDTSSQIIAPSIMAKAPYDPAKDFVTISIIATSASSIVVNPSVPAKTLAEFIPYAKSLNDKLSYGSAGAGTVTNLAGELFKQLIKAPGIVQVPYRGAGPGLTDLIAGNVPMMTPNVTGQVLEMHRTGKLRILAVCAPQRLKAAPDIPAANETLPGLEVQLAAGIFGPAGLPPAMIQKVSDASSTALKDPEFIKILETAGLEARPDASAGPSDAFITAERKRLLPIIEAAGMKQPS
jgi:tripartite-type tricarboxylate transporter receptor subunit TctC